jgi:hypothetical protein
MSTPLPPDALWNLIQPLLPAVPLRPKGGRPRLPDRACLTGVLFVLRSGIPWGMLPQELPPPANSRALSCIALLVARNENRRLELSAQYISTTQAVQVHVLRAAAAVVIYVDIG